jgi:hypothetical protein
MASHQVPSHPQDGKVVTLAPYHHHYVQAKKELDHAIAAYAEMKWMLRVVPMRKDQ